MQDLGTAIPTDASGQPIPYRMVFADRLQAGDVVLTRCIGANCRGGTAHEEGRWHQLSVLDLRRDTENVCTIACDETGNQIPWDCYINGRPRIALPLVAPEAVSPEDAAAS